MAAAATAVQAETFKHWAVLDLFGHQRIAGEVTEQQIGGASFIRVDVPAADGEPVMTRYYNPSAVYSISPVTREIALAVARKVSEPPVTPYDIRGLVRQISTGDAEEEETRG